LYAGATYTAAYDRAKFNEANTTYTNSNVSGNNINITSAEDTNVKGANVNAKDTLNLNVGNDLNVVSVQNRQRSDSKSMGINLSSGSAGFTTGKSRSNQKQTVVTSIIGKEVNANVNNETYIQGATIASVDENGNDNNNLNLKTNTLKYDDLSNTSYSNNKSTGGSVSFSTNENTKTDSSKTNLDKTSIQYSNGISLSKDKTLSTVGKGNLEVANTDESSDLERLNRDVSNTIKDIYDVDRQKGNLDITIDDNSYSYNDDISNALSNFTNNFKSTIQNSFNTYSNIFGFGGYGSAPAPIKFDLLGRSYSLFDVNTFEEEIPFIRLTLLSFSYVWGSIIVFRMSA
jgi:hypothetical protein